MPIFEAIVLGIVQGLTEFLPVSSTAHLALTPWLVTRLGIANWSDPGLTFDVALHAGTLFAILLYFWRTWIQIVRAALGGKVVRFSETSDDQRDLTPEEQRRERQLLWYMIAATIPAAIAGATLEKQIETTFRDCAGGVDAHSCGYRHVAGGTQQQVQQAAVANRFERCDDGRRLQAFAVVRECRDRG